MPGCIAPGCSTGHKSNPEKLIRFAVPKDEELKKKWQEALRSSKPLSQKQVVCEKHFRKGDIIRVRLLLGPNDQLLGVSPYARPKLKPGAVPFWLPWTEADDTQEQDPEVILDVINPSSQSEETEKTSENDEIVPDELPPPEDSSDPPEVLDSPETPSELPPMTFSDVQNASLVLPPWWTKLNQRSHKDFFVSFSEIVFSKDKNAHGPHSIILKELVIDSNLELRVYVLGEPLKSLDNEIQTKITSEKMLEHTLYHIHRLNICKGCMLPEAVADANGNTPKVDCQGSLRHRSCELLTKGSLCKLCRTMRKTYLMREKRRNRKMRLEGETKRPKLSTRVLQRKLRRREERIRALTDENKNLKKWYVKMAKKCEDVRNGENFLFPEKCEGQIEK